MQRNPTNVAVMENVETDEARFFNLACMRQRTPGIDWEPSIPSHAEEADQRRQAEAKSAGPAPGPDPIVEDFPYTSKQPPSEDSDLTEE